MQMAPLPSPATMTARDSRLPVAGGHHHLLLAPALAAQHLIVRTLHRQFLRVLSLRRHRGGEYLSTTSLRSPITASTAMSGVTFVSS